ncbi:MAG: hypothetical protein LBO62_06560 [Endomicrobium sp.]|jgi:hypothetical protein|nr:hypothetical protein [Endomicrobium sp.]
MYIKSCGELENLINSSPIFNIDKKDCAVYETERDKILWYLYKYCNIVYQNKNVENFTSEIIIIFDACIEKYSKDKGKFLHYFNVSFSRTLRRKKNKEINAISMDNFSNEDKDSTFENYIDDKTELDARRTAENKEEFALLLQKLNSFYISKRADAKEIISAYFTTLILEEYGVDKEVFNKCDFINSAIVELYKKDGKTLSQRDLGKFFKRNEASITRTLKPLKKLLEALIKEH